MDVQQRACWTFEGITNGPDESIELAIPLLPKFSKFLSSGQELLVSPSLHVFGNFTSGNDQLTQV